MTTQSPSFAGPEIEAPEVSRMLTLSTGHLPPSAREKLDALCFAEFPYGWILYVGGEDVDCEPIERVLGFAQANECEWVRLDADGPRVQGLPWYEDSEEVQP